ncbi:MAG: prolyl oligopeptidase family serine peptidase [Spirochaetaceae bacterium]|nr:prolyl oligopeptidase family serine peptidase [Spirochaetaceae bacterium]
MKTIKILTIPVVAIAAVVAVILLTSAGQGATATDTPTAETSSVAALEKAQPLSPMAIESLRQGSYPGGNFVVEEQLADGSGFEQYVVSYLSEGLKIYGLLTVPLSPRPEGGYPGIMFIHGYIPPSQYSTIRNYATYQARLARNGFVTFKPDLRGHGNSEGEPVSAHYSEKYVVDTLNAIAYMKDYEEVNPERIGYWGHSNGGEIGLRVIVASSDIKAASLWAGVVGSYVDMFETYNDKIGFLRNASNSELVRTHGMPSSNPHFWDTIEPYRYLNDITAALEIQHGTADKSVPVELSRRLKEELERGNIPVEYYEYPGDDHNISGNAGTAFQRSIDFYNRHL